MKTRHLRSRFHPPAISRLHAPSCWDVQDLSRSRWASDPSSRSHAPGDPVPVLWWTAMGLMKKNANEPRTCGDLPKNYEFDGRRGVQFANFDIGLYEAKSVCLCRQPKTYWFWYFEFQWSQCAASGSWRRFTKCTWRRYHRPSWSISWIFLRNPLHQKNKTTSCSFCKYPLVNCHITIHNYGKIQHFIYSWVNPRHFGWAKFSIQCEAPQL